MGKLILFGTIALAAWLCRQDTLRRQGVSLALWIPTLWVGVLLSRPVSIWLGASPSKVDPSYSLEGSAVDRYFYLGLIAVAIFILLRRGLKWQPLIRTNWPVFLFYGFLLLSTFWADITLVSLKRWIKEFGNILMVLIVLTERTPTMAIRAVFARCAFLLFPLSVVFIRYFSGLGRYYDIHTGQIQAIGVTMQKNSLGMLVLVCSLPLFWDLLEWKQSQIQQAARKARTTWKEKLYRCYIPIGYLLLGIYLLKLSNSKTNLACFVLGGGLLLAANSWFVKKHVPRLGLFVLLSAMAAVAMDSLFGIKEWLVTSMGRDLTFTGRTDVWRELLSVPINSLIGTGFCSFWSNLNYRASLPEWVEFSAHNGYLETYLDGGLLGIGFLAVLLLWSALKINWRLAAGGNYSVFCFAVLLVTLIGNYSESNFARMTPLGFVFLLAILQVPGRRTAPKETSVIKAEAAAVH